MSMGGWNHRGANVTARVVVPEGWMDPHERWMVKLRTEIEARRLVKNQEQQQAKNTKEEQ